MMAVPSSPSRSIALTEQRVSEPERRIDQLVDRLLGAVLERLIDAIEGLRERVGRSVLR